MSSRLVCLDQVSAPGDGLRCIARGTRRPKCSKIRQVAPSKARISRCQLAILAPIRNLGVGERTIDLNQHAIFRLLAVRGWGYAIKVGYWRGTNGIIINVASTAKVLLEGLDIEELGTGLDGVQNYRGRASYYS